jgi:hypothetical protein
VWTSFLRRGVYAMAVLASVSNGATADDQRIRGGSDDGASLAAALNDPSIKWGVEMQGLQAGISLDKTEYRSGEPILVRFLVRNVGARPQVLTRSGFWPNHKLIVIDLATSTELPLTDLGQQARTVFNSDGSSRKTFSVTIEPGAADLPYGPFDVSNYFQIESTRSYSLRIQCLYVHGPVHLRSGATDIRVE